MTFLDSAVIVDHLDAGDPLGPRDLFVAATARSQGDRLVVADAGFDTDGLAGVMTVTDLRG